MSLILLQIALLFLLSSFATAATPANEEVLKSAKEKGKLVADDYMGRNILPNGSFNYFEACSYYGAYLLGEAIKDTVFCKSIYNKYKNNSPSSIPTGDVDKNSCGLIPLYLSKKWNDSALLKLGKAPADVVVNATGNTITAGKTYVRMAIDDTYMVGSLMVQAFRATRDTAYLNFCALYISTYMNNLQQSTGLYWHKLDSKNYWGRGNGWGAASSTELLQELPATHAKYAAVLDGYKKQMNGLLAVQQTSGLWMQLLDSKDSKNWIETSGSAMFLFALFTGLKNGWLDKDTFLDPAKKGWTALAGYLQNGKLTNVAAGFWPSTGTASEYLNASRGQPGDSHGTAAFLWAAAAAVNYFSNPGTFVRLKPSAQKQSFVQILPAVGKYASFDILGRAIVLTSSAYQPCNSATGIFIGHGAKAERKFIVSR